MALTEKQKRALAGLATPDEDNQKFHAGVMPLASDEDPQPEVDILEGALASMTMGMAMVM